MVGKNCELRIETNLRVSCWNWSSVLASLLTALGSVSTLVVATRTKAVVRVTPTALVRETPRRRAA